LERKNRRGWNAKWASLSRWYKADGVAGTAPARAARFRQFELEVDPDFVLSPEERHRRAKMAERAFLAHAGRKGLESRWGR
jgi:hypothetical protein